MRNDMKEHYKKEIEKYLQTKEQLEKSIEEALLEYPSIDAELIYSCIKRLAYYIRMMEIAKLFADNNRLGALKMLSDTKHLEETRSLLYKKYDLEEPKKIAFCTRGERK